MTHKEQRETHTNLYRGGVRLAETSGRIVVALRLPKYNERNILFGRYSLMVMPFLYPFMLEIAVEVITVEKVYLPFFKIHVFPTWRQGFHEIYYFNERNILFQRYFFIIMFLFLYPYMLKIAMKVLTMNKLF